MNARMIGLGLAGVMATASMGLAQPVSPGATPPTPPGATPAAAPGSPAATPEPTVIRPAEPPKVAPTRETPTVLAPTTEKGQPLAPAKSAGTIPGLAKEDPALPKRRFYPEGTFLSKRSGKLVKASTGDVVFVPSRDAKGRGEAPMVVLPTQTLARLEAAPSVFAETSTVVLSGEVYVYFDRQYILPTVYSVDRQIADAPATQAKTPESASGGGKGPDAGSPGAKPTGLAADPAVADLIQDLETKRGSAKAPDVSTSQAVAPANATGASGDAKAPETGAKVADSVTTEGSVLFNKRARLTRVASGPLMVAFDGDSTSAAPAPMVLLRCRMAQKLDELAASRGDDLVVQVSGRVFVYGGRNYLLPTLAQVVPKGDVKTLQ